MFEWGERIISGDPDPALLKRTVHFLSTYVTYHFAAEEYVMEVHGYDRKAAHFKQHDLLRAKVDDLRQRAQSGEEMRLLIARVDGLFREWYVEHIGQWDKALARFLKRAQPPEEAHRLPSVEQLLKEAKLDAGRIDVTAVMEVGGTRGPAE
jgi:hemerythrin-like metal-binding protein